MLMISASVRILQIRCLVDFARTHLMARLLRRRLYTTGRKHPSSYE
jgi:hypothetical protein